MPDIGFDISLKINGAEIAPEIRAHINKLEFEESLSDTAHLDIEIKDCEFFNIKRSDFDLRAPLRVPVEFALGQIGKLELLFSGDIAKVEPKFSTGDGTSSLQITCKDVSARMKREPEPFVYETDKFPNAAVIAKHIIAKYGFDPILNPETELRNWLPDKSTTQISRTDWELLNELAENLHLRLFARGTKIYLVDDDYLLEQQQVKWTFIQRADRADLVAAKTAPLLSFQPELSSTGQRLKCEVKAYASIGESGVFSGSAELKDFYSDGKTYTNIAVAADVEEVLHIRGKAATSTAQAHDLAMAYLRARADRLVSGEGRIPGNPAIRAGSKHTFIVKDLGTFGKEFSGDYWITAVRHKMSVDGGVQTIFDVRRDGLTVA